MVAVLSSNRKACADTQFAAHRSAAVVLAARHQRPLGLCRWRTVYGAVWLSPLGRCVDGRRCVAQHDVSSAHRCLTVDALVHLRVWGTPLAIAALSMVLSAVIDRGHQTHRMYCSIVDAACSAEAQYCGWYRAWHAAWSSLVLSRPRYRVLSIPVGQPCGRSDQPTGVAVSAVKMNVPLFPA